MVRQEVCPVLNSAQRTRRPRCSRRQHDRWRPWSLTVPSLNPLGGEVRAWLPGTAFAGWPLTSVGSTERDPPSTRYAPAQDTLFAWLRRGGPCQLSEVLAPLDLSAWRLSRR
ncbi:MAG: hypothetical protein MZV64_42635 [Ignavibacteriales bacterium]|nr:hypothetical protein [Ignavibacteriales bacterium]